MKKLDTKHRAVLQPFTDLYAAMYAQVLDLMASVDDLDALEEAANAPDQTNCGWMTYDAAGLIRFGMAYTRKQREARG